MLATPALMESAVILEALTSVCIIILQHSNDIADVYCMLCFDSSSKKVCPYRKQPLHVIEI